MAELRGMWRQQVFFPFKIFILKLFLLESSFCRGTFSSNQNVLLKNAFDQQGREEDGKIGASSGRYLPTCLIGIFPLYSFLFFHNNDKNNLLFSAILHSSS